MKFKLHYIFSNYFYIVNFQFMRQYDVVIKGTVFEIRERYLPNYLVFYWSNIS